MPTRWSRLLAVVLAALVAAGPARADDDDDDFEKRYRKQQRKYEEQRRDAARRFAEQQREAVKREDDRRRKLEGQYRDDLKRQERWQRQADRQARERLEDQLRRQPRDAARLPDFGPVPGFPPPPPAFGPATDQTWLPAARRAAAEFGPQVAQLLNGLGAGNRGLDPRAARAAADLARRAERLTDLARRDADLAALRREYAGFDAGWQQLTPYLDRAAGDPAGRDLAWRVYQAERQLRLGVGYAPQAAVANWAAGTAAARTLTAGLGQLVGLALRGPRPDQALALDLRNAQQEAQQLEGLIARQAGPDQLREQHDYLGAVMARSAGRIPGLRPDAAGWAIVQQVMAADRELAAALGLPAFQDDAARGQADRTAELAVAADRLRRELWAALGAADPQVVGFYLQPADQLAARADLLSQMVREGRPPELVQAGWQGLDQLAQAVGTRVGGLDRVQFDQAIGLAVEVGRQIQELRPAFAPVAVPPPPGR